MKDIPLGLAVCHCHNLDLVSEAGQQLQKFGEAEVDRRDDDKEDEHDHDHDARRLERLGKGGPGDALELGKRLFDLSARADEDVGLLIPLFYGLLGRVLLFDVELFGAVVGLLHSHSLQCAKKRGLLLRFLMHGVLLADGAVLLELETIGIVALIFEAVVIPVFAFRAFKRDLHSRGFGSHAK